MVEYFEIGQISNTHGLKGELKVRTFTESKKKFEELSSILVDFKGELKKYDIEKISVGQSAEIVQGNTVFKGQVSKIYMVAETDASGKPKVKVDILLNVGDTKPIIGLETEVTINAGSSTQTLAVPDEAVYADDGGDYVYILDNKKVAKRYVTVGNKGISNVEILDGLDENDHVITTVMTDGQIGTKYREK